MNQTELIKILIENFSKMNVKVCSQYHIQVQNQKGKNNIWLNKNGFSELKFQAAGDRNVVEISISEIIKRLKLPKTTHFDEMNEILNLSSFVHNVEVLLKDVEDEQCIFVDSGFKNGRAKAAAVLINKKELSMDICVRITQCNNSYEAECFAIEIGLGLKLRQDNKHLKIYTDNQPAAEKYKMNNVIWIPRKENTVADKLSNLRDKK